MQQYIGHKHAQLGHWIASKPCTSIILSLLFTVILMGGMAMLEGPSKMAFLPLHNDFLDNFAPKNHKAYTDYKRLDESFEAPRFTYVSFRGDNILRKECLLHITLALQQCDDMSVTFDDNSYNG